MSPARESARSFVSAKPDIYFSSCLFSFLYSDALTNHDPRKNATLPPPPPPKKKKSPTHIKKSQREGEREGGWEKRCQDQAASGDGQGRAATPIHFKPYIQNPNFFFSLGDRDLS